MFSVSSTRAVLQFMKTLRLINFSTALVEKTVNIAPCFSWMSALLWGDTMWLSQHGAGFALFSPRAALKFTRSGVF